MICQVCGKKTATTHVKTIVNGQLTELHLCSDCAREKGYGSLLSGWGLDFGSLLGGFFGSGYTEEKVTRCEKCGASFEEIAKNGKLGCADCYKTFRRQLLPMIQKIHGTTHHKGKTPTSSALRIAEPKHELAEVKESLLEEKKRLLKKAVENQEFEQAALLRDEIKEMENHG